VGPGGEPVQDAFYFVRQPLAGSGVRTQWNYTGETPGLPGTVSAASPRWLRLGRDGDTLTGYDSADGTHWTRVGTVRLAGLPSTVQAGLFVTSPRQTVYSSSLGSGGESGGPTASTAVFDHVSRTGTWPASAWTGDYVGAGGLGAAQGIGGYHQAAGPVHRARSGDIAPLVAGPPNDGPNIPVRDYLIGTFGGPPERSPSAP
jgi:hypothetical protein